MIWCFPLEHMIQSKSSDIWSFRLLMLRFCDADPMISSLLYPRYDTYYLDGSMDQLDVEEG